MGGLFGGVKRFAGDVWNKHIAPAVMPQPAVPKPVYGPGGSPTGSGVGQAQQAPPPVIAPERKAVSDTLSYAEGTWNKGNNSPDYTMRYGDRPGEGSLDTSQPHPRDVRGSIYGSNISSNASGAFQFMDDTWQEQFDGKNAVMSPQNQDRAVGQLIDGTGFNYDEPFEDELHKLSGRWASVPNESGVSNYNQPVHSVEDLSGFHSERLKFLQNEERKRVMDWRVNN